MERAGRQDASWHPKTVPDTLAHIWRWFGELHRGRQIGYRDEAVNDRDGRFVAFRSVQCPLPLTHVDIDAWARTTERRIGPFALSTLRTLDNCYFATLYGGGAPTAQSDNDVAATLKRGLSMLAKDSKSGRAAEVVEKKGKR